MFIYGSAKKPDEKKVKSRSNLKQNWVKLIAVLKQNAS